MSCPACVKYPDKDLYTACELAAFDAKPEVFEDCIQLASSLCDKHWNACKDRDRQLKVADEEMYARVDALRAQQSLNGINCSRY